MVCSVFAGVDASWAVHAFRFFVAPLASCSTATMQSSSSPFHTTSPYNLSQDRSRAAASTAASPYGLAGSGNMNYGWNSPAASGPSGYPTGASLNDSLSQSRSQYQSGYLLVRIEVFVIVLVALTGSESTVPCSKPGKHKVALCAFVSC